jgi:hypothetical protein
MSPQSDPINSTTSSQFWTPRSRVIPNHQLGVIINICNTMSSSPAFLISVWHNSQHCAIFTTVSNCLHNRLHIRMTHLVNFSWVTWRNRVPLKRLRTSDWANGPLARWMFRWGRGNSSTTSSTSRQQREMNTGRTMTMHRSSGGDCLSIVIVYELCCATLHCHHLQLAMFFSGMTSGCCCFKCFLLRLQWGLNCG